MKTIKQAAKEYADTKSPIVVSGAEIENTIDDLNLYAQTDFEAGVNFAQEWISPQKDMPPVGELVQVKLKWIDQEYSYDHDKRVVADGYDDFEINQMCWLEVVGWRPINLK